MLKEGNIYRFSFGKSKYLLIYKGLCDDGKSFEFKILQCSSGLFKKGSRGTLNINSENELEEVEKMSEVILELL